MTISVNLANASSDTSCRRSLSDLSLAVAKSKKIVVVTGAGISCSCGIPDFRSSDGLYNLVKQQYPDVVLKGRDLFDASLFRDPTSTSVFYTFISKLKESIDKVSPSPTHNFIKTLETKGKLLRSYTQNIDGLEERVGLLGSSSAEAKASGRVNSKICLKAVKNVQLHGDLRRVRCTFCSADFPFSEEHCQSFNNGHAPDCPECVLRSEARVARSARALKIGTLRPAIVLYDEPHPLGDDIGSIQTADLTRKPDLLIIMGTSLKVHGLKKLVKEFAKVVHTSGSKKRSTDANTVRVGGKVIFINKTQPSSEWDGVIDYHVEGETDAWVGRVLEDWKRLRPADWEVQTKLCSDDKENSGLFKVTKNIGTVGKSAKGGKRKTARPADGPENVPPSGPSLVSTNVDSAVPIVLPPVPLSPSKRRQGTCHYSAVESSPSKKRNGDKNKITRLSDAVPAEERGLLFGPSKNMNVAVELDLRDVEITKAEYASAEKLKKKVSDGSIASIRRKIGVIDISAGEGALQAVVA